MSKKLLCRFLIAAKKDLDKWGRFDPAKIEQSLKDHGVDPEDIISIVHDQGDVYGYYIDYFSITKT